MWPSLVDQQRWGGEKREILPLFGTQKQYHMRLPWYATFLLSSTSFTLSCPMDTILPHPWQSEDGLDPPFTQGVPDKAQSVYLRIMPQICMILLPARRQQLLHTCANWRAFLNSHFSRHSYTSSHQRKTSFRLPLLRQVASENVDIEFISYLLWRRKTLSLVQEQEIEHRDYYFPLKRGWYYQLSLTETTSRFSHLQ